MNAVLPTAKCAKDFSVRQPFIVENVAAATARELRGRHKCPSLTLIKYFLLLFQKSAVPF